mmetsp:Transcript_73568/g.172582  ORF Transcript_73568/g.172582 Transcript_73568/m.172582 type:complete len:199 (-) Transcript_73568:32-628(-)
MGCSQGTEVATATTTEVVCHGKAHGHRYPSRDDLKKNVHLQNLQKKMVNTSSEGTKSEMERTVSDVDKLVRLKDEMNRCVLQIEDQRMVECEGPETVRDYDSWKHELDATDKKALKQGHSLPVNQKAHVILAKKMETSLTELLKDPTKLERAVKERRMSSDEVAAYLKLANLNATDESSERQEAPMQPTKSRSTVVST